MFDDGERQITKKRGRRKAAATELDKDALAQLVAGFIDGATADLAAEYNEDAICSLGDAEKLLIGLPFPSFALELVFGVNALPLSRVIQVVGLEGTYKSAFGFEVIRWFCVNGGVGFLLEHETKFNPLYARSIIGWDRPKALTHVPCDSINEWQSRMQRCIEVTKTTMLGDKKNPGPGKIWPVILDVDSVMAKSMQETQDKIAETGFAGRSWSVEAQSIASFMRKVPGDLRQWPFLILLVNHLKPHTDQRGIKIRNKPGGAAPNFQATYEVELDRAQNFVHDLADSYGRRLKLKVHKNSMATDRLDIPVEVRWWYENVEDPRTGKTVARQHTKWCWHESTIRVLMRQDGERGSKIRKLVDLRTVRNNTAVVSSALGISESDPVDFETAGELLMARQDLLEGLRTIYGIPEIKVFRAGLDYDAQVRELKETVREVSRPKREKPEPVVVEEPLQLDDAEYQEEGGE